MKFDDIKLSLVKALFELLSQSDEQEWFTVSEILAHGDIKLGGGLVGRVLVLSQEEEDIFSSSNDGGVEYWTLGREGFDLVEASQGADREGDYAPAADRIVRFNHNSPEASEIAKRIEETLEAVRGVNSPEVEELERRRVSQALVVARDLWQSGQFKVVQFRVGVLLAVEDAAKLVSSTTLAVSTSLLVDALKSFAKRHFHIDLDAV